MGRKLRTRLDLVRPSIRRRVEDQQHKSVDSGYRHYRDFTVGDRVMARNYRDGDKWVPGVILTRVGPMSYEVKVQTGVWRRHIDQIVAANVPIKDTLPSDDASVPDFEVATPKPSEYMPPPTPPQVSTPATPPEVSTPATPHVVAPPEHTSPVQAESIPASAPRRYPLREHKAPERLSYK